MVLINGKEEQAEGMTVMDWLAKQNLPKDAVAVELNGKILPRDNYPHTKLNENDAVEIVRFMGGG